MSRVTRFPNGIGTISQNDILGDIPVPNPVNPMVLFEDFHRWPEGGLQGADALGVNEYSLNQVTSVADSGDVLPLSVHPDPTGSGGRVRLQTNAVTVASDRLGFGSFQWVEMEDNNQVWYETLFNQRTDSDQIEWIFGITNTINQLNPNDGIYFKRSPSTTDIEIILRVNDSTLLQETVLENFVNNQDYIFSYHYDRQSTLRWEVKSIDGLLERGGADVSELGTPDESLRPSSMIRAVDALQKQIDIDYFLVVSDIVRLGSAG